MYDFEIRFIYDDNKLDYIIYEKNLPYKDEMAKHMLIQVRDYYLKITYL